MQKVKVGSEYIAKSNVRYSTYQKDTCDNNASFNMFNNLICEGDTIKVDHVLENLVFFSTKNSHEFDFYIKENEFFNHFEEPKPSSDEYVVIPKGDLEYHINKRYIEQVLQEVVKYPNSEYKLMATAEFVQNTKTGEVIKSRYCITESLNHTLKTLGLKIVKA